MRVGLLTTGFPRFDGDHCGAFLLTLARRLVDQGHQVHVLAPEPAVRYQAPRWPGVELRWLPYLRPRAFQRAFYGDGAPDNLHRSPGRWLGAGTLSGAMLVGAFRELAQCDALLSSWCLPSGLIASIAAEGRDHLCICHETDLRWLSRVPGSRSIARRIARGATSMWFLSVDHRDRFARLAGPRFELPPGHVGSMPVEPPSSGTASQGELRRRLGLRRFTVLYLGRLVPVKGVDRLLRAVGACHEPIHVRIAGDGPERDSLSHLAHRLGVDASFEGWVSGARKEALLRAADTLVVPSRPGDGLPTVLFEARAHGLPAIASRLPATRTYRGVAGSRLVDPDDDDALRDAIETLAQAADAVTGSRARCLWAACT